MDAKQRGTQHNCEAGAGVHAENAGVGKGITRQSLHQRSCQAQRGAGQQSRQGSRQPGVQHDRAVGTLTGSGKSIHDDAHWKRFGANQQAESDSKG